MDVYYEPEKVGLRILAETDRSSGNYEFDCFVVWQHIDSGRLYYDTDEGCSCSSPFQGCQNVEELSAAKDVDDVLTAYDAWLAETPLWRDGVLDADFVDKLRGLR